MVCDGYTKVWELAPDELVKLDGARGTMLRVTRGTLWITLENDTRDIVLEAGDAFTIDRGGLTLVEAQGRATVCVMGRPIDEVHVPTREPAAHARIGNWLRSFGAAAESPNRFVPRY
ncbi:MAG TPA: DUF2917 domain-containing protein [Casimicrobiaceae bacterium]|nr:DUF2917 domain-containing protein [Casimicrobiaceae bacterium]